MNEVLKRQIDKLIDQIQTPFFLITPEQQSTTQVVHTIIFLAREHLMGVMAIGLHLGGMTEEEMFEEITRANVVTTPVNSAPKV